jgi:hypothetical protein
MNADRHTQVGLDRLIRCDWLEKTAAYVSDGNRVEEIKPLLQSDLRELFRSARTDVRGSLDKTITILLRVWVHVPAELEPLRIEGLELLRRTALDDHRAIHWGMIMAVYPFWSHVALQTGRLLRLQSAAAASQIQRRVREHYGERETVSRRVRYVLRSFLAWDVLRETDTKGVYAATTRQSIDDVRTAAWMIEASLHARVRGSAPLKELLDSPSLFPFRIRINHADSIAAASTRLDIIRHGLDDDLVVLRGR